MIAVADAVPVGAVVDVAIGIVKDAGHALIDATIGTLVDVARGAVEKGIDAVGLGGETA